MIDSVDLPDDWTVRRVADVTRDVKNINPGQTPDDQFYYVDISSIDNKRQVITEARPISGANAPSRARRPIQPGDVLFSNVRTYLRNVAPVDADIAQPAVASTGFTLLRPTRDITQDYLLRLVTSDTFIRQVTPLQTGTQYPATSDRVVRDQLVPVPPIDQQRQITDLLTQLDHCRDTARLHLARARQILSSFRQAVLAVACSGELTESWRDERDLPDWTLQRASELCEKVQSGGTPKSGFTAEPGVPFLKVYNIVDQNINFDYRAQFVPEEVHRGVLKKSIAYPGDVVMNIVGPPLGKVAIIPDDYSEWNLNQAITIFRPGERLTRDWLYIFLCSGAFMDDENLVTRGSAGQSNISLTQCRNLFIPVPTVEEQEEIARRVEQLLTGSKEALAQIEAAETLLVRTCQAATAKAFRGELRSGAAE